MVNGNSKLEGFPCSRLSLSFDCLVIHHVNRLTCFVIATEGSNRGSPHARFQKFKRNIFIAYTLDCSLRSQ